MLHMKHYKGYVRCTVYGVRSINHTGRTHPDFLTGFSRKVCHLSVGSPLMHSETAIWTFTINLYLRENTENAAPKNVLRDAEYLLYTFFKVVTFVSSDKWHRKFVNEVPLFEGVREQFIFVDNTTKATIQEGFSKLL